MRQGLRCPVERVPRLRRGEDRARAASIGLGSLVPVTESASANARCGPLLHAGNQQAPRSSLAASGTSSMHLHGPSRRRNGGRTPGSSLRRPGGAAAGEPRQPPRDSHTDGYGNKRVAEIKVRTEVMKRHWGAHGDRPKRLTHSGEQPRRPNGATIPQSDARCSDLTRLGWCTHAGERLDPRRRT